MLTILNKSVSDRKIGSFRTHKWKSSNNLANTLTETFWSIRTPYHKFKFIQFLQLRVLMDRCSLTERRCCYDAPGVLEDDLFIDALRAWKTDVPRKILWQRLQLIQRLEQRPEWSENLYYTYDGNVSYDLEEVRSTIRKVKKYSGYVRNSSAVGSKRKSNLTIPEPEIIEWNSDVKINYYHFLTVGEFDSGAPGLLLFTLKSSKERNGIL